MEFTYSIPERFDRQAGTCAFMGSHLYGALCGFAARAYERHADLRVLLDRHTHRSRLVLRLLAAAHFRALQGSAPGIASHFPSTGGDGDAEAAWNAILSDVRANTAIYDELLARPVQTAAIEVEASGGAPASLGARLEVASRAAFDLHPLDVSKDVDADTLLSFVWPDQHERFERLKAAIEIARAHPVAIEAGDGIDWIARTALPVSGSATVALHTVVTEHLPQNLRQALSATMSQLGAEARADAPFAWVRMEPGRRGYQTIATLWPGEREMEVAVSDGHAQDLRWTATAA